MSLWRSPRLLVVAVVFGVACGDGAGPGGGGIALAIVPCLVPQTGPKVCPVTSLLPNDFLEVTITATPPTGGRVQQVIITLSGVIQAVDTFVAATPVPGPATAVDSFHIPAAIGALTISATARSSNGTGVSSPVNLDVADTVPPTIALLTVLPADSVEPGDSVTVTASARDNALLTSIVLTGSGALTQAETLYAFGDSAEATARFQIPPAAGYGTTFTFTAVAHDVSLPSLPMSSTPRILRDFTLPTITGGGPINGGTQDPIVPGDTLSVAIDALDNHRLVWVGFRVGQPVVFQDSVAVNASTSSLILKRVAAQSWAGTPIVTLFARDSTGNLGTQPFPLGIRVLDAVRRPTRTAAGAGAAMDMAFDVTRGTLYLLRSSNIRVLPIASLTDETPIALPIAAIGRLDLTPSDDSLLVTFFPYKNYLGVVDLTQAVRVVDTVPMAYDTTRGGPYEVAVAANNLALIAIEGLSPGLLAYDLATGTPTMRTDVGAAGVIPNQVSLIAAQGRGRIVVAGAPPPCCPNDVAQVYDTAGDAFSTPVNLPLRSYLTPQSADSAGTRFLVAGTLFDGALATVGTFAYPSNPDFPNTAVLSTMSADGQHGYFSQIVPQTTFGTITKVRLSDGVVLVRILLPKSASAMLVTPDGTMLVAVAPDYTVMVVDLP